MLHTEWKWSKGGRWTNGRRRKKIKVGVRSFHSSMSKIEFTLQKIKNFPDDYKPHQWFMVMVWDNLSNWHENSPKNKLRLAAAYKRHLKNRIERSYRISKLGD